jgi:hypothetical protein
LTLQPNEFPSDAPLQQTLARKCAELFVLLPRERARRRRLFLVECQAEPDQWRLAAQFFAKQSPAIAAIAPDLLGGLAAEDKRKTALVGIHRRSQQASLRPPSKIQVLMHRPLPSLLPSWFESLPKGSRFVWTLVLIVGVNVIRSSCDQKHQRPSTPIFPPFQSNVDQKEIQKTEAMIKKLLELQRDAATKPAAESSEPNTTDGNTASDKNPNADENSNSNERPSAQ